MASIPRPPAPPSRATSFEYVWNTCLRVVGTLKTRDDVRKGITTQRKCLHIAIDNTSVGDRFVREVFEEDLTPEHAPFAFAHPQNDEATGGIFVFGASEAEPVVAQDVSGVQLEGEVPNQLRNLDGFFGFLKKAMNPASTSTECVCTVEGIVVDSVDGAAEESVEAIMIRIQCEIQGAFVSTTFGATIPVPLVKKATVEDHARIEFGKLQAEITELRGALYALTGQVKELNDENKTLRERVRITEIQLCGAIHPTFPGAQLKNTNPLIYGGFRAKISLLPPERLAEAASDHMVLYHDLWNLPKFHNDRNYLPQAEQTRLLQLHNTTAKKKRDEFEKECSTYRFRSVHLPIKELFHEHGDFAPLTLFKWTPSIGIELSHDEMPYSMKVLQALGELTRLHTLVLSGFELESLEPLMKLVNLRTLVIIEGTMTNGRELNITPLAHLKLETLIMVECPSISNVAPLQTIDTLTRLNVRGCPVRDLACLSSKPNLVIQKD